MASYVLDRREAVPAIIGKADDFLVVAGLGGAARDLSAITGDASYLYPLGGAMGAAVSMGLGLALARSDRKVLVVTGDGELLMNIGALATVAVLNAANLSILVVDNGHYGETGYQKSHTALGVDLERMAQGAGIRMTTTVEGQGQIGHGARLLREANGTAFVVLRVKPTDPQMGPLTLDPVVVRTRFVAARKQPS